MVVMVFDVFVMFKVGWDEFCDWILFVDVFDFC